MWLIDKSAGEAIQFTPVFVDGPAGMATYEEAKHFANLATRAVLEAVEQRLQADVLVRCVHCNALIETDVHCDNCGSFHPTRR